MKIGWCKARIEGFSDPIKAAKRSDGWAWWGLFGVMVLMGIAFVLKIYDKI